MGTHAKTSSFQDLIATMLGRRKKNEDLSGYLRGAHQDGVDVCPGFIFHARSVM